ncbi:MAG: hypothetical protein ABDI19_07500 [Armatimonadota bacterium]
MNRWLMACTAGAILCASFAFADGQKNAQLQLYTGPIQYAQPLQACKVRLVDGQIIQVGPWIDLPQFSPAGGLPPSPCAAGGDLAFDNFEFVDGTLTPGENTKYGAACGYGGGRWWFGASYRNPFWVNDMTLVPGTAGRKANALTPCWANTNPGGVNFIMAIFTADDFDATCQGPAAGTIYDGVAYNFGNLPTGAWYSLICLTDPTLFHQMPSDGQGAYIGIYLSSLNPPTLYPGACQPLLWGTKPNNPSQQGPIQWDDDAPTDGTLTAPTECYDYTFPNVCPNPLGAMMAFWVEPPTCTPHNGDVDENNCVDDADLLQVLFAFGQTGSNLGRVDVNCDQVVDDGDLLTVLFNFGSGC